MQKIPEIKNLSDGMVVDAVQVKVDNVYERRPIAGGKTVQGCMLVDDIGNKIKASAWNHPDLTPLKGGTYILHSTKMGNGQFGGVSVKHGSWTPKDGPKAGIAQNTVELSINKAGAFQHVEVYKQNAGTPAQAELEKKADVAAQAPTQKGVNGQTVGMAIGRAIEVLIATGLVQELDDDQFAAKLHSKASDIIRVSQRLEAGDLAVKAKETANAGRSEGDPF